MEMTVFKKDLGDGYILEWTPLLLTDLLLDGYQIVFFNSEHTPPLRYSTWNNENDYVEEMVQFKGNVYTPTRIDVDEEFDFTLNHNHTETGGGQYKIYKKTEYEYDYDN